MGNMEKAARYHKRAMDGIVEDSGSNAKKSSVLSLWKMREKLEDWIERHCTMMDEEAKNECLDVKKLALMDKKSREVQYKTIEDILKKRTKLSIEELPTARNSQYGTFLKQIPKNSMQIRSVVQLQPIEENQEKVNNKTDLENYEKKVLKNLKDMKLTRGLRNKTLPTVYSHLSLSRHSLFGNHKRRIIDYAIKEMQEIKRKLVEDCKKLLNKNNILIQS